MTQSIAVRRLVVLAIFVAATLLANFRVVQGLIELSRVDDTASHVVLVPVVSAALLYRARRSIASVATFDVLAGVPLIVAGLALLAATRLAGQNSFSVGAAGLAVSWVGGFVAVYGRRAGWAALFPLLFLLFMIPMPAGFLSAATNFLKVASTETVARLFAVAHVPFNRDGFVFILPGTVIEVADECSGIRSSIALTLTGLIAAHLMLSTTWKKAVIMAVILPIAILKNGIRIVGLSMLAIYVDPRFLEGRLHHEGGVVFFLLGLALLGPILLMLQRSEPAVEREALATVSS